jgi:hypothetical protein
LLRGLLALLAGGALGLLAWQGTVHQAQLLAAASWLMGTERDLASPGGTGRHVPLLAGSSAFALAAIGGAVWLRRARAAKPAPRKRKKSK